MSLYEAKCRITFKFNQSAIQDLSPGARQTSRGSMSNWLYLIGSFCFVAGTLLNMADFNHGALKDAMRCRAGFPTLQHFQQRDQ